MMCNIKYESMRTAICIDVSHPTCIRLESAADDLWSPVFLGKHYLLQTHRAGLVYVFQEEESYIV